MLKSLHAIAKYLLFLYMFIGLNSMYVISLSMYFISGFNNFPSSLSNSKNNISLFFNAIAICCKFALANKISLEAL